MVNKSFSPGLNIELSESLHDDQLDQLEYSSIP